MTSITAAASSTIVAAAAQVSRPSRVSARRATFNGLSVRPRAVRAAAARPAAAAPTASLFRKNDGEDALETSKNVGFNVALAAMVAGSVFMSDVISPEWAEAGRSGGRMGGGSFRAPSRGGGGMSRGGMGGQSRQAPNVQAMPQRAMGMGGGYGMPMFMPFGFSPFGYGMGMGGMGMGMGGMGFIFQALAFFWVANFFVTFLSAMGQQNNKGPGDDDDKGPPRY